MIDDFFFHPHKPALGLGQSVNVQFTLETSSELSVPTDWCSDATESFVYHFGVAPPIASAGTSFAVGIFAGLGLGILITALVAAFLWRRAKKAQYSTL